MTSLIWVEGGHNGLLGDWRQGQSDFEVQLTRAGSNCQAPFYLQAVKDGWLASAWRFSTQQSKMQWHQDLCTLISRLMRTILICEGNPKASLSLIIEINVLTLTILSARQTGRWGGSAKKPWAQAEQNKLTRPLWVVAVDGKFPDAMEILLVSSRTTHRAVVAGSKLWESFSPVSITPSDGSGLPGGNSCPLLSTPKWNGYQPKGHHLLLKTELTISAGG